MTPSSPQGLNLLIYPSTLQGASRVMKIATSLQSSGLFGETHAVGVRVFGMPDREEIAPQTFVVRIKGSERSGNIGRILKAMRWQPRVFGAYKNAAVSAVAAESVAVLPLAARIARRTGAVLIYNPHELETETDSMKGFKKKFAKWIERHYLPKVRVLSAVNRSIADWYANEYQIGTPVVVMNVPVDNGSASTLRKQLGLSADDMLYVHTGNLGPGRNIPLMLEEFARRPHLQLLLLGEGPLRELVAGAVRKYPNIHSLPPVPANSVVGQMRGADVGLCLMETDNSLNMRFATPNKLFEALFADTPPLTSDFVEARVVLGDLAANWVLDEPRTQLAAALDCISKGDVAQFRSEWKGFPGWDAQVAPLVSAYRSALGRNVGINVPH